MQKKDWAYCCLREFWNIYAQIFWFSPEVTSKREPSLRSEGEDGRYKAINLIDNDKFSVKLQQPKNSRKKGGERDSHFSGCGSIYLLTYLWLAAWLLRVRLRHGCLTPGMCKQQHAICYMSFALTHSPDQSAEQHCLLQKVSQAIISDALASTSILIGKYSVLSVNKTWRQVAGT